MFTGSQTDDVSVNWISVLLPGLAFLLKLNYYLEISAALDFGECRGKYPKGRWEVGGEGEIGVGQGGRGHEEEKREQWKDT